MIFKQCGKNMYVKISVKDLVLETERLILRPWRESDLADFYEYASVPGVGEMAGWPHHTSIEESKSILAHFLARENVFALVYKENNKVIGSLGFHPSWTDSLEAYKDLRISEIGYVLSKDYWGRGLMAEAVRKVIAYFFENDLVDAFTVGHYSFNNQSRRVIEKCGFQYVKTENYTSEQTGKTYESLKYILHRKR